MGSPRPVVDVQIASGVGTVTLNRPESLNAMSRQLMGELRSALQAMADDPAVRCVALRGAGRAFCAGGDVADIASRQAAMTDAPSMGALMEAMHRRMVRDTESILLLKTMAKPTVAVVQGWAVGGGMSLALAADFRVLGRDARLRAGFMARSLSGDFGISGLLVGSVGSARARDILLRDRTIDSEYARELGLANLVCDDESLATESDAFIRELADGPTIAIGRSKDNLNAAETLTTADLIVVEALNQRISAATSDAQEAGRAFAEKRKPRFTGQ